MADEVPSWDKTVSAFFEMVALAFVFEGVSALLNGKSWQVPAGALLCGALLSAVGLRLPWVKGKVGSISWMNSQKWINRALFGLVVLALTALVGIAYYDLWEWKQLSHEISHLFSSNHSSSNTESKSEPKVQLAPPADWHDKGNWRRYLHTGMTRTEVRQLFGEPERVSVVSSYEYWEYGDGRIDFDTDGSPDGSLNAWFEPN